MLWAGTPPEGSSLGWANPQNVIVRGVCILDSGFGPLGAHLFGHDLESVQCKMAFGVAHFFKFHFQRLRSRTYVDTAHPLDTTHWEGGLVL